ncbi:hypothetical protein [Mogibacterium diversum]
MGRLIEHKRTIFKIAFFFAIITITAMIVLIPKPVLKIRKNIVYMSGFYIGYPQKDDPRYYLEIKDNGTYILIYDDSRRLEENYNEDGGGGGPEINIYYGKYEKKDDNYLIKPSSSAMVSFKNTIAVKNNIINGYGFTNYGNNKNVKGMILYKNKAGVYVLGVPNHKMTHYKKDVPYYMLYNKSDIKKLPSSVEEFRKQFKMDKKAEQERLAEQNR